MSTSVLASLAFVLETAHPLLGCGFVVVQLWSEIRTAGVAMDSRDIVSFSVMPLGDVIVRYPLPSYATSSTRDDADVRDLGRDGSRMMDVATNRRLKASLSRFNESKKCFWSWCRQCQIPDRRFAGSLWRTLDGLLECFVGSEAAQLCKGMSVPGLVW